VDDRQLLDERLRAGQTVILWFNDHDDGYAPDPTYVLLDDILLGGS